jgi:biopolymer transport protein ExbB/TolQ/Holliday junction resolvasome RuvABC endonuclease subunit
MRASVRTGAGSLSTVAAFVIGVPLGAGLLWAMLEGPLRTEETVRYLHHPVECVEVMMFSCALGALLAKIILSVGERRAFAAELIPTWDGKAVSPIEAERLLAKQGPVLKRWRGTFLGRRVAATLEFVRSRGSASELDDQLRTLSDVDAMAQESSYALLRFITWAIPILGFLGTVLGITAAISGIKPEDLENINKVTGGLSLSFDATALALGLTMLLMFISFLVERIEQSNLEHVDAVVEAELGHRFIRTVAEHEPMVRLVEANTERMLKAIDGLIERQAAVWAKNLELVVGIGRESSSKQHQHLLSSLETALEATLTRHTKRLADVETQLVTRQQQMVGAVGQMADVLLKTAAQNHDGLREVAKRMGDQTQALVRLQEGGAELSRLQEMLAQNLASLAGSGAFEQAVQSLTAAIHLMTTRVTSSPSPAPKRVA